MHPSSENDLFVGPFVDQTGFRGISFLDRKGLFDFCHMSKLATISFPPEDHRIVCHSSRELLKLISGRILYDVTLLYGGERKLFNLAEQFLPQIEREQLGALERLLSYHLRACKTAKIDLSKYSILDLVPADVILRLTEARAKVAVRLFDILDDAKIREYETDLWPLTSVLYQVEENGIKIDDDYVRAQAKVDHSAAESKFFRHMAQSKNGYVYTRFNPCPGKTGRIRTQSGFHAMTIPHGAVRDAIVSRYAGGTITTFDYNAIDYRCIVSSVPELADVYDGCEDFHSRTAELLGTSAPRDTVKQFSYMCIYGGSDETLAQKTGMSLAEVSSMKALVESSLSPIIKFRQKISSQARRDGFVMLPTGKKIPVSADDHDGKIIGLYAQSYSSEVFRRALIAVQLHLAKFRSKVIFTVHDELVLDHYPSEGTLPLTVKSLMEETDLGSFRVNVKKGRTYGEATDG